MKVEQRMGGQMELTLDSNARPVRRTAGSRRRMGGRQRALWWFREMHRVVDDAIVSWSSQPLPGQGQGGAT